MLSSRVCPSVRLSVRHKPGLYRNDLTDTAGLGMGASLEPMLHCAVRKFGYLQNKDTSLWNLPQTLLGLRKFRHGKSIEWSTKVVDCGACGLDL